MARVPLRVVPPSELGSYGSSGRPAWLDTDWAQHLAWASIGGDRVSFVDVGTGPAMVLIHGLGGSWRNWLENILAFATTHRVIALDLPGFGASPRPNAPISMVGYADLVVGLLQELGIDRAAVIGNSMGGLIAMELALRYPERVGNLVLVSPAGLMPNDLYHPGIFEQALRLEPGLRHIGTALATNAPRMTGRRRLRTALLNGIVASPVGISPALAQEFVGGMGTPGFMPALHAVMATTIRGRADQLELPVLLVWGSRDRVIPVKDAYRLDRVLPQVTTLIYSDTGHVAMAERPHRFRSDVLAFLSS